MRGGYQISPCEKLGFRPTTLSLAFMLDQMPRSRGANLSGGSRADYVVRALRESKLARRSDPRPRAPLVPWARKCSRSPDTHTNNIPGRGRGRPIVHIAPCAQTRAPATVAAPNSPPG